MTVSLAGKIALMTGASRGIGAAVAKRLAAAGATVVINYATSRASAEAVVADIVTRGGQAWAVQGDVARLDDVTELFAAVARRHQRLDVLVNTPAYTPLNRSKA